MAVRQTLLLVLMIFLLNVLTECSSSEHLLYASDGSKISMKDVTGTTILATSGSRGLLHESNTTRWRPSTTSIVIIDPCTLQRDKLAKAADSDEQEMACWRSSDNTLTILEYSEYLKLPRFWTDVTSSMQFSNLLCGEFLCWDIEFSRTFEPNVYIKEDNLFLHHITSGISMSAIATSRQSFSTVYCGVAFELSNALFCWGTRFGLGELLTPVTFLHGHSFQIAKDVANRAGGNYISGSSLPVLTASTVHEAYRTREDMRPPSPPFYRELHNDDSSFKLYVAKSGHGVLQVVIRLAIIVVVILFIRRKLICRQYSSSTAQGDIESQLVPSSSRAGMQKRGRLYSRIKNMRRGSKNQNTGGQ